MSGLRACEPMAEGGSLNGLNIRATHSYGKSLCNHHCHHPWNMVCVCGVMIWEKWSHLICQSCPPLYVFQDIFEPAFVNSFDISRPKIQSSCVVHARFPEQMLCSVSSRQSSLSTLFSIGGHTHTCTWIYKHTHTQLYIDVHKHTHKHTHMYIDIHKDWYAQMQEIHGQENLCIQIQKILNICTYKHSWALNRALQHWLTDTCTRTHTLNTRICSPHRKGTSKLYTET